MSEINNLAGFNIKIAEDLNVEKAKAIKELENRLNTCPDAWKMHTKRFIEVVRTNIAVRKKLIKELKAMGNNDAAGLDDIVEKLKELDKKDNIACDIYSAAMDEGII